MPLPMRVLIVMMLRVLGESVGSFHTSPKSTSSL